MTPKEIKKAAQKKAFYEVYAYKSSNDGMVHIGGGGHNTKEKETLFNKIVKEETERLTKINQNQES